MTSITPIILARSGSRGIPNKNIKLFNGRPLLFHSISNLLEIPDSIIDPIIISTDSEEYKDLIEDNYTTNSVHVQMRPEELSGANITSEEVLYYVINQLEVTPEYILFVQCTSPLTCASDFGKLIHEVLENDYDSACFYLNDYGYFFELDDMLSPRLPRQERYPRKRECGNAWLFKTEGFMLHKTRLFGAVGMVELEYPKNIEIDTEEEFKVLEIYQRFQFLR